MCLKSRMDSKPQVCLASKLSRHQRPDGDCALRLERAYRFETAFTFGPPLGLMDSRRYRGLVAPPLMSTGSSSPRSAFGEHVQAI